MGLQLWFHAHGIDESNVHKPIACPKITRHWQLSNLALWLPSTKTDIELVFREMAEQVAIRWWRKKKTQPVSTMPPTPKSRASVHSLPQKDWAYPIHCFIRYGSAGSFLPKHEGVIGKTAFMENLFLRSSSTLSLFWWSSSSWKKRRNLSRPLTGIGINLAYSQKASLPLWKSSRAIARSKLTGGIIPAGRLRWD